LILCPGGERCDLFRVPSNGAIEILVQREQGKRLKFPEGASQLLFDTIHLVEESAAIHAQFAAAKLPIGSEQEVVRKNLVLMFVQRSFAHQAKVSHKLFILQTPNGSPLSAGIGFEGNTADIFLL
jgi:hypothetical protein